MQIWEFDNLHMTQCAKIIVGFMANVGNVFLPNVYKRFFLIFISTFITSMVQASEAVNKSLFLKHSSLY